MDEDSENEQGPATPDSDAFAAPWVANPFETAWEPLGRPEGEEDEDGDLETEGS